MWIYAAALLWGFAEATLFFIVPDVLTSAAALRDARTGLRACVFALIGALAGGALMYDWGARDEAQAVAAVEVVPGIDAAMMARVRDELARHGAPALLVGPLTGTPYKTYAVQAAGAGIGRWEFLAVSVPGRLPRFVLVTLLTAWVVRRWLWQADFRTRLKVLLSVWALFYAAYFLLMTG
jgi:membrane protein YqaA with SNARE-associated domain